MFDIISNGFDLVIFHDEILTDLLWKQPPWKPPWKMIRDLLFLKISQQYVLPLCDFLHMMRLIDDALGRNMNLLWYHILVSSNITSQLMESKRLLIKVQTTQLALMKNIWRGSWCIIVWVVVKDVNHLKLWMNKANMLLISTKSQVSESSTTTFYLFLLIKVMSSAFLKFHQKGDSQSKIYASGHNRFHL